MNTKCLPLLVVCLLPSSAFSQGSLTPPGAPAPTMKTLDQLEPRTIVNAANTPGDALNTFRITQPGSYYLTGNLTGVSGKSGISISSSGVILDLNGFTLQGVAGSLVGINISGVLATGVSIRNGTIRNWPSGGLNGLTCTNSEVSHLRIQNSGQGLRMAEGANVHDCVVEGGTVGISTGDHSIVRNCISVNNTGTGIHVSDGSGISHCSTEGGAGISTDDGAAVTACVVLSPTGIGFEVGNNVSLTQCSVRESGGAGFATGARCTLTACTAESSGALGILAGTGSTVADCQVSNSSGIGIFVGDRSVIRHSVSISNAEVGIQAGQNCVIVGSTAGSNGIDGNATFRDGIRTNTASNVLDCVARNNQGDGIHAGAGSTLTNCTATENTGEAGIFAGEGSTVTNCTARLNQVEYGIQLELRGSVMNCTSSGNNSAAAESAGIFVALQGKVDGCTVTDTTNSNGTATGLTGAGIIAGNSSVVRACVVAGNRGDGIHIGSDALVVGNNCDSNGFSSSGTAEGAGIHSTGTDNRIESNNVTDNDRGIEVDSTGSLIIKNSASGSTGGAVNNYVIAAGNADAAIEVPGTAFTSTNPWANFSF